MDFLACGWLGIVSPVTTSCHRVSEVRHFGLFLVQDVRGGLLLNHNEISKNHPPSRAGQWGFGGLGCQAYNQLSEDMMIV